MAQRFSLAIFPILLMAYGNLSANDKTISPAKNLNWSNRGIQLTVQHSATDAAIPTCISLRPNSNQMAIVGDDHLVRIQDRDSGKIVRILETHSDWIKSAKYHPNGQSLYTAGADRRIMVWNSDNQHDYSLFASEDRAISGLEFDSKGEHLFTIGFSGQVNIYDVVSRKLLHQVKCPCRDIRAVAVHTASEKLAVAGRNGIVRLINFRTGKKIIDIKAHRRRVRSMQFIDSDKLVTASEDKTVKQLDLLTGQVEFEIGLNVPLHSLSIIGQNRVAVGATNNQIHIVDLQTKTQLGYLAGHDGTVTSLVTEGKQLFSGGFDTQIRIWDIADQFISTPLKNQFGGSSKRPAVQTTFETPTPKSVRPTGSQFSFQGTPSSSTKKSKSPVSVAGFQKSKSSFSASSVQKPAADQGSRFQPKPGGSFQIQR